MRIGCPQCGASLQVLERDFYIRCPFCGARIPVSISGRDVRIVRPVLDETAATRPFPKGSTGSARLRYYPYRLAGPRLVPAFNQPVSELEDYTPPTGDTVQFDTSLAEPDQLIPPGDDDAGSVLVFHPVWVVQDRAGGAASYVDAVGGNRIGRAAAGARKTRLPSETFMRALFAGMALSVPLYFAGTLSGGGPADLFGVALAGSVGGVAILYLVLRSRRR